MSPSESPAAGPPGPPGAAPSRWDARRDGLDAFGVVSLTGFALLLAVNQVVIKVTTGGLQPVFFAGLRSAGAFLCLLLWLRLRGRGVDRGDAAARRAGAVTGAIFAAEFTCLFLALDLTTVARTSVIFYSMPVWTALFARVALGERIGAARGAGLALSVAGVALAMSFRQGGEASLAGDLFALLAAMGWAATLLMAKASALNRIRPESQLVWQVGVSAPLLLLAAPLFGPLVRDLAPVHLWGLAFQTVVVVAAGFSFWLYLLRIYPASAVASFSFLSPVFGVALGWALLDEPVGPALLGALALVAAGIVLINRPVRR